MSSVLWIGAWTNQFDSSCSKLPSLLQHLKATEQECSTWLARGRLFRMAGVGGGAWQNDINNHLYYWSALKLLVRTAFACPAPLLVPARRHCSQSEEFCLTLPDMLDIRNTMHNSYCRWIIKSTVVFCHKRCFVNHGIHACRIYTELVMSLNTGLRVCTLHNTHVGKENVFTWILEAIITALMQTDASKVYVN